MRIKFMLELALAVLIGMSANAHAETHPDIFDCAKILEVGRTNLMQIRRDLQANPSFTVFDIGELITEATARKIFDELPKGYLMIFDEETGEPKRVRKYGLDPDQQRSKPVMESVPPEIAGTLIHFSNALKQILNSALEPSEKLELSHVQIRSISAGDSVAPESSTPNWHRDGQHLRAIISLIGDGTEYSTSTLAEVDRVIGDGIVVPRGHVLIFSGESRGRALVHRTPSGSQDRLIFVIGFQPGYE